MEKIENCPDCGSTDLKYSQYGFPVVNIIEGYMCRNCRLLFGREGEQRKYGGAEEEAMSEKTPCALCGSEDVVIEAEIGDADECEKWYCEKCWREIEA